MYWYYNLGDYSFIFYILAFGIMIWSLIVRARLNSLVKKYSNVPVASGKDANTCVHEMLAANEVYGVTVKATGGEMTDNYNPKEETINLSETTYGRNSITAVAVAAHECGHAVQHEKEYAPLKMRSALVPVVSAASRWMTWILLIGMLTVETFPQLLLIGIALFATTTLFSFITLPVEIDASRRAVNWLQEAGVTNRETTDMASDALRSAAYTYVVAALSSLATLIYYILIFLGGNRR